VIYAPFTLLLAFLLLALLGVFVLLVEMRVLTYAYRKVGVRPRYAFAVMLLSLIGSHVNIPLYAIPAQRVLRPQEYVMFGRVYVVPEVVDRGETVVAMNVGGALIPILVSLYLLARTGLYRRALVGVAIVAVVVHALARVVPGVGIAVPMIVPPLVAAAAGLLLSFRRAPPVAYVAGSLGTLIGADLLNLGSVASIGAPVVSIGGAGTFDGVFLTGIIAGLLA
jgi:uncharacterized membrane protein